MATAEIPKRRSKLVGGFRQLTLNPTPRLRQMRQSLDESDTVQEAWTATAEALAAATARLEQSEKLERPRRRSRRVSKFQSRR
jgi:hypothetical protein